MEIIRVEPELKEFAVDTLANVPLLSDMSRMILLQLVDKGRFVNYTVDEVLIQEAQPAESLFVLLHGLVSVYVERRLNVFMPSEEDDIVVLGEVAAPATVGEVSFLLDSNRTASVKAKTNVQTLEISKNGFFALFENTKGFGLGVARGLASRVNGLSEKVVQQTIERSKQQKMSGQIKPSEPTNAGEISLIF